MDQKKLDRKRSQLDWGVPLDKLPVISWDDYVAQAKEGGRAWIAVAGVIHDVSDFISEHPGGRALIRGAIGKDATAMFNGGVYDHSNAAHNLLSTMRVGVIRGGMLDFFLLLLLEWCGADFCPLQVWRSSCGSASTRTSAPSMSRIPTEIASCVPTTRLPGCGRRRWLPLRSGG